MFIKNLLKFKIRQFFLDRGIFITRFDSSIFYNSFISLTLAKHKLLFKKRTVLEDDFLNFCISNYNQSYSQRGQDLFCLYVYSKTNNENKLCIEFGASDGKFISNTYLLSKKNFKSILVEPSKLFFKSLKKNRPYDYLVQGCIKGVGDHKTSTEFYEAGHYSSTLNNSKDKEVGKVFKSNLINKYRVKYFDLNTLIKKYFGNSKRINYISIDIEGNELEVLKSIDYNIYKFDCMTIECPFTNLNRQKIIEYLNTQGYFSIFTDNNAITGVDLWFINNDIKLL